MNEYKLFLILASEMLSLAEDNFSSHRCNDLEKRITDMIPNSMLEEMRQWNSNGKDPWPEKANHIGDSSLMHFLSDKLKEISTEIDRDIKLTKIGIQDENGKK